MGERKSVWLAILTGTVLCGCSTVNVYKEADGLFVAGNYKGSADCVRTAAEPKIESSHLLNWLYMGSGDFASGNHPATVADFTAAESCLKLQNMQFLDGAFSGGDYLARTYDETMMNFYQALSFLAGGKIDRARVEFNRVAERQGRAARRNEAKIAEAKVPAQATAAPTASVNASINVTHPAAATASAGAGRREASV